MGSSPPHGDSGIQALPILWLCPPLGPLSPLCPLVAKAGSHFVGENQSHSPMELQGSLGDVVLDRAMALFMGWEYEFLGDSWSSLPWAVGLSLLEGWTRKSKLQAPILQG